MGLTSATIQNLLGVMVSEYLAAAQSIVAHATYVARSFLVAAAVGAVNVSVCVSVSVCVAWVSSTCGLSTRHLCHAA